MSFFIKIRLFKRFFFIHGNRLKANIKIVWLFCNYVLK
nr:MAG TPA: hypothetical protein [Caudoviricetes sp.]